MMMDYEGPKDNIAAAQVNTLHTTSTNISDYYQQELFKTLTTASSGSIFPVTEPPRRDVKSHTWELFCDKFIEQYPHWKLVPNPQAPLQNLMMEWPEGCLSMMWDNSYVTIIPKSTKIFGHEQVALPRLLEDVLAKADVPWAH